MFHVFLSCLANEQWSSKLCYDMYLEISTFEIISMQRQEALDTLRVRNCQDRENHGETSLHPKAPFCYVSTFAVDERDQNRFIACSKGYNVIEWSSTTHRHH